MDAALKILHSQDFLFLFAWDYFIISLHIFIHSTMAMGERIGLLLPIFEEKFSFAFGTSTVGIY